MPYGEELIRTRDIPDQLKMVIKRLSQPNISVQTFDADTTFIENSSADYKECFGSLPDKNKGEDDE